MPGQFGTAQENDFDSLFPPECGVRGCGWECARVPPWAGGGGDGGKFPDRGLREKRRLPRRQMADLIGRTVPRIGSLARRRAKQAAPPVRSASRLHNARARARERGVDFTFRSRISPIPRSTSRYLFPYFFLSFLPSFSLLLRDLINDKTIENANDWIPKPDSLIRIGAG